MRSFLKVKIAEAQRRSAATAKTAPMAAKPVSSPRNPFV
jgi:hypothetical protein